MYSSLECLVEVAVLILAVLDQLRLSVLAVSLDVSLFDVLTEVFRAHSLRRDERSVLPKSFSAERVVENLNRLQSHAWSNLDQDKLLDVVFFGELLFVLIHDLECSEPDSTVVNFEGQHMIDEWFALWMVLRRVKHRDEHLLRKSQVSTLLKCAIKREKGPRELQAVASQLQLLRSMDVRHQELRGWPVRALAKPHEKVFVLVLLEEEQVVAGEVETEVADGLLRFLSIDFRLFLSVGQVVHEIGHQVAHAASDSTGAHYESSLSVLPLLSVWLWVFECKQLVTLNTLATVSNQYNHFGASALTGAALDNPSSSSAD